MIPGRENEARDLLAESDSANGETEPALALVPAYIEEPVSEQLSFDISMAVGENEALTDSQTELVESHLDLVQQIGRRFYGTSFTRADLEGEGLKGLIWAAINFNPRIGAPFEAYARSCIRGSMTDALRDRDRMIRPIRKDSPARAKVKDTIAELNDGVTHVPDSEIAARTGMMEVDVRHYRYAPRNARIESLDKPILSLAHGGTVTLLDLLIGSEDHAPDVDLSVAVQAHLDELDPQQAAILRYRYGLEPFVEPHSQKETAWYFCLSEDQVYRREKNAKAIFRTLFASG